MRPQAGELEPRDCGSAGTQQLGCEQGGARLTTQLHPSHSQLGGHFHNFTSLTLKLSHL